METLVLSTSYEAVGRVSWKRAITLLFEQKAEVVSAYEDRVVRSVSLALRMPSVVRLLRWLGRRKRGPQFSRQNVYARDRGRCQYCSVAVTRAEATWDHVVPRSRGGRTNWENIVIACVRCNHDKGGRTPTEARMTLRTQPVRPTRLALLGEMSWQPGMPPSWRAWLRDYNYWNGALESD